MSDAIYLVCCHYQAIVSLIVYYYLSFTVYYLLLCYSKARFCHPDKNASNSTEATAEFQALSEAYQVC